MVQIINNLNRYANMEIANVCLNVDDVIKYNPLISKWLDIYELYGRVTLKTLEDHKGYRGKSQLQFGFETLTYLHHLISMRSSLRCRGKHVLDEYFRMTSY